MARCCSGVNAAQGLVGGVRDAGAQGPEARAAMSGVGEKYEGRRRRCRAYKAKKSAASIA